MPWNWAAVSEQKGPALSGNGNAGLGCIGSVAKAGQLLHDAGHPLHILPGHLPQHGLDALDGIFGGGVAALVVQKQSGQRDAQPVTDPLQRVDGGVFLAALDHADGVDVQIAVQRQLLLADAFQDPEVPQLGTGPAHHGVLFLQQPHPL